MTFAMGLIPEVKLANADADADPDEFKGSGEQQQQLEQVAGAPPKSVEDKATELIETAYTSYLKLLRVCSNYTNEQQIMGNAKDNEMKKLKAENLIYKHILNPEEAKKAHMRAEEARI